MLTDFCGCTSAAILSKDGQLLLRWEWDSWVALDGIEVNRSNSLDDDDDLIVPRIWLLRGGDNA